MQNTSLTIVGMGIKFASHITKEAEAYICQSDKILYLVNEPLMEEWIQSKNKNSESLERFYAEYQLRLHCYQAITRYILENLYQHQHVCVVMYGHPAVYAKPGVDAINQARKEGYDTLILPAISAEDCLFADLAIDPSTCGCQSFEATDFLIYKRPFSSLSHLILWQVGVIGALGNIKNHDNRQSAKLLINYLSAQYDLNHNIILYEASQYPHFLPSIIKLSLKDFINAKVSGITTMYVPPQDKASIDEDMLRNLQIDLNSFKKQIR